MADLTSSLESTPLDTTPQTPQDGAHAPMSDDQGEAALDAVMFAKFRELSADDAPAGNTSLTGESEPDKPVAKTPPRAADGKFTKTATDVADDAAAPKDDAAEAKDGSDEGKEPPAPTTLTVPPPASWSADAKAKWSKLEPDVQAYISEREKQAQNGISQMGNRVRALQPLQVYAELTEKYGDFFKGYSAPPPKIIDSLIGFQAWLDREPEKAYAHLGKQLGLTAQPAQQQDTQVDQYGLPLDPAIVALRQELSARDERIAAQERRLSALAQRQEQEDRHRAEQHRQSQAAREKEANYRSVVNAVADQLPDFGKHEQHILKSLPAIQAAMPWASPDAILTRAYYEAVAGTKADEAKAADARNRAKAEKETAERAKRATSVNVRGEIGNNAELDEEAAMRARFRQLTAA